MTGSNPLVCLTRPISQISLGDFFLMRYYVYILYSENLDVYYKGFSTDVEKRLEYNLSSQHIFTYQSLKSVWEIFFDEIIRLNSLLGDQN